MGEVVVCCQYCGRVGEFPEDIELRATAKGDNAWACIDTAACDERDAENEDAAKEDGLGTR